VPETPEQAEARRFRCAEEVLRLVCPDPRVCPDRQCRRRRLCRHFLDLHAQQRAGRSPNPRRTPGAAALRRAMWLYVNGRRAWGGRQHVAQASRPPVGTEQDRRCRCLNAACPTRIRGRRASARAARKRCG